MLLSPLFLTSMVTPIYDIRMRMVTLIYDIRMRMVTPIYDIRISIFTILNNKCTSMVTSINDIRKSMVIFICHIHISLPVLSQFGIIIMHLIYDILSKYGHPNLRYSHCIKYACNPTKSEANSRLLCSHLYTDHTTHTQRSTLTHTYTHMPRYASLRRMRGILPQS